MAFTGAVLKAADAAAKSALSGRRACLIVKQLKGAGVHATGAKSHNLYAHHTLDSDDVKAGLRAPRAADQGLGDHPRKLPPRRRRPRRARGGDRNRA